MSIVNLSAQNQESWQQKLGRKFKEEPYIPIGTSIAFLITHAEVHGAEQGLV